jgi:hypothetical protein
MSEPARHPAQGAPEADEPEAVVAPRLQSTVIADLEELVAELDGRDALEG